MQLNKQTIDELKTLRDMYRNRDIDEYLFKYFLDIISKSKIFSKEITFKHSSSNLYVNLGEKFNYEINGSVDKCVKLSHKFAKVFSETDENILLFTFYQILHELSHIEQQESSYYLSNSLGELYRILIEYSDKLRSSVMYSLFRYRICFERNANINASRENMKIFSSKINEIYYLYNLFSYYYESKTYVKTPVDDTFSLFGIKEKISFDDLSFIDIMEHGCSLNETNMKKYYELSKIYEDVNLCDVSYDSVYKKMLELR